MKKFQQAFTIVELLIVVVVIAILAAITIVAYNGIQERTNQSVVKSDITATYKTIELFRVNSGSDQYPTALNTSTGIRISKGVYDTSGNNVYYCYNITTNQFALGFTAKQGKSYLYSTTSGLSEPASRVWGADTCAAVGTTWGGANTASYVGYNYSTNTWSDWTGQ